MLNMILAGIGVLVILAFMAYQLSNAKEKGSQKSYDMASDLTFEELLNYVKDCIHSITRSNLNEAGLSASEYRRSLNKRAELMKSLKSCVYGSLKDKNYVKEIIFDILIRSPYPKEALLELIPVHAPHRLGDQDRFDILLQHYKKNHGAEALSAIIDAYDLDRLRYTPKGELYYAITPEDMECIYSDISPYLDPDERLMLLSQRLYQAYKGFSVIDEIRDMQIDGVSGGVSGVLQDERWSMEGFDGEETPPLHYESVWIFFRGKSVRMSCLRFPSEAELKRVCQNIYRFNNVGMLSQDVGYKVNEMADGSRVVVVRPAFSEGWAFFVRKFQTKNLSLENLITGPNAELPIGFIRYLAKGARITAVTGAQGSGKTTLLMAMVGEIYGTLTLRIQEMAFELNLRKLYPRRNILSFRETDTITGQQGLDVQKKTDGSVNILGEVATDPVAAWMIQMAQVASLFTLFTHHAKTAKDLILSLRNSLLKCDVFRDEKIAEEQVVSVLNFNIHLNKNAEGHRYVERITEIIPVDQREAYPAGYKTAEDSQLAFMDTRAEFYARMTDRKTYRCQNLLEYRKEGYVTVSPPTMLQVAEMAKAMTESDREAFLSFVHHHWEAVHVEYP